MHRALRSNPCIVALRMKPLHGSINTCVTTEFWGPNPYDVSYNSPVATPARLISARGAPYHRYSFIVRRINANVPPNSWAPDSNDAHQPLAISSKLEGIIGSWMPACRRQKNRSPISFKQTVLLISGEVVNHYRHPRNREKLQSPSRRKRNALLRISGGS